MTRNHDATGRGIGSRHHDPSPVNRCAPERLIIDVLAELMHTVGVYWEFGSLSIGQEHLVSGVVRDLLGSLARMRPPASEHAMLFVTPPGEMHEFGILMAATRAITTPPIKCPPAARNPVHVILCGQLLCKREEKVTGAS